MLANWKPVPRFTARDKSIDGSHRCELPCNWFTKYGGSPVSRKPKKAMIKFDKRPTATGSKLNLSGAVRVSYIQHKPGRTPPFQLRILAMTSSSYSPPK
jgi:hypothetical protein